MLDNCPSFILDIKNMRSNNRTIITTILAVRNYHTYGS